MAVSNFYMKSRTKQSEPVQNVMNQCVESLEKEKKYFKDSIKWLELSQKQLNKSNECTNDLISKMQNHKHLHYQISGNLQLGLTNLYKELSAFNNLLIQKIQESKNILDDAKPKISAIKNEFQSQLNDLVAIQNEFKNELQSPNKSTDSGEFLQYGFEHHREYLKYFNQLTETQKQIETTINDTKNLIDLFKEERRKLTRILNENTPPLFGIKPNEEVIKEENENYKKRDLDDKETFNKRIDIITDSFNTYRSPSLKIPDEFKFEPSAKIDMEISENFQLEQYNFTKGEIVSVTDSSLAEFWKIRNSSGIEIVVPAKYLIPKQKQSG